MERPLVQGQEEKGKLEGGEKSRGRLTGRERARLGYLKEKVPET